MADTKKVVAKAPEVKAEEVKKVVAKKAEAPKAEKKAPAKKAEAPKAEKKAPAKKVAAPKAEKKAPAKKVAAPKAEKKAAAKSVTEVSLQFADKEYSYDKLVEIAKDVWKYDLAGKPADLKEIKLFVKPEESKVYYVLNGKDGSFDI